METETGCAICGGRSNDMDYRGAIQHQYPCTWASIGAYEQAPQHVLDAIEKVNKP